MANGRQRKRDVLLAKKAAEQAAKNGLAGLSPEGLTSIVSNDANDLDNISYSTTDGATVNIKNNRVKDSAPTTNVLGGRKGYMPGNGNRGITHIMPNGVEMPGTYEQAHGAGPSTRSNLGGRKGYMPGNQIMEDELILGSTGPTTRSNLGGRKGYMPGNNTIAGGPTTRSNLGGRKGYMPGSTGPTTRSSKGFNFDDEMLLSDGPNVRGSARPQAKAITEFIGEDLSPEANNQFYTVDMDSADDLVLQQDNSVIGETLNDDGTVTYELPPSNLGDPEVTKHELTEAQLEPGIYDNVEPGEELALTPTLDNKGYNFDDEGNPIAEQPLLGRMTEGERAQAALDLEEQLKEEALTKQLEADTKDTGLRKGYMPGNNNFADAGPSTRSNLGGRKGYLPGDTQDGPSVRGSGNFDGRKGYKPGNDNDGVDSDLVDAQLEEIYGIEDGTVKSKDSTDVIKAREELAMIDQQAGSGLLEEGEITPETAYPNIHENEPGTTPPEVVAKEVKDSDNAITAATAGNHHLFEIANEAKREIEGAAEEVETGKTDPKTIADKVKNSLGSLGELLGIDGKDLIRALFRYAGGRIFGMSGNEAGRFMYEGFMTDEAAEAKVEAAKLENSGLGANATANQKNYLAYKNQLAAIDQRVANGELTEEEGEAEKETANMIYGVDKQQRVSNYNVKGIRPDGTEDVVYAKTTAQGDQLILENGKWIPIEESDMTDIQKTTSSANQPYERGVADKRILTEIDAELAAGNITQEQADEYKKNASIPNATRIDAKGNPSFAGKFKNETESDSYSYALRMVNAQPAIDVMLRDPETVDKLTAVMSGIQSWGAMNGNDSIPAGVINNLFKKENLPQQFRPLTSMWLQGLLRKDTGAAYSGYEYNDYLSGFMPISGDLPGTIEQKRLQMVQMTRDMAANAGAGSAYLMGRMDGEFRMPDGVQAMVDLATGVTKGTSIGGTTLSAEELDAWNSY